MKPVHFSSIIASTLASLSLISSAQAVELLNIKNGNEMVSNSSNPRLRHFFISYKNWMVGQNWSTFMPLHALSESLYFGGPHLGEVFARQTQIRYSYGN
jgi:hypothetical protein